MRVGINLLTEDPAIRRAPTGSGPGSSPRWPGGWRPARSSTCWSARSRGACTRGTGPSVSYITYPWSNERRKLRTLSEHLYSPVRLPLGRIDVLNTLMAPIVNPSWSLVIHMKTMHAYTAPDSVAPLTRAYRRMSYPRSAKVAEAIIINSESLRAEIKRYLEVDDRKLKLIYEAVDHDLFKPGDAGEARAQVATYGVTKPFVLFVSSLWPYKNCDGLLRAWAQRPRRARRPPAGDRRPRPGREVRAQSCTRWRPSSASPRTCVFVGGVPLEETVPVLPGGGRVRVPVVQRDLRAAHPRGDGVRLPGRDLERQRHAGDRGRCRSAVRPEATRRRSPGPSVRRPGRPGPAARRGPAPGGPVHLGGDGRGDPRRLPRGRRAPAEAGGR